MPNLENQRVVQNAQRKLQRGKPQAAVKAAIAGLKKFPNDKSLMNLAGIALTQAGDHKAAAKVYSELHKLNSNSLEIRMSFGLSLVHARHSDTARDWVSKWLDTEPESSSLRFLSAVVAVDQLDFEKAASEATLALAANPNMGRSLAIRGLARFELKQFEKALEDFQRYDRLEPRKLETLLNIGFCYNSMRLNREAIKTFQKCVELFPNDVSSRTNLAMSLEQSGEMQAALSEFNKVLQLTPTNWTTIARIVELNSIEQNREFEGYVRKHLRKIRKNSPEEIWAALAIAKLLSKNDKWAEAEGFYQRSNTLRSASRPYFPKNADDRLAATFELFPPDQKTRAGGDTNLPRPIFVIGQPRSGTTLMEMMISSHPDVVGLGEFGAIEEVALLALSEGVSYPKRHARAFRSELPNHVSRYKAFVDKMPANYMFVGFLAEAFPDAKFIHIERDPREVAISMWKNHFAGEFTTYTSDFSWMAHAANTYRRYMLRWEELYPQRILSVSYKDIVRDTENLSRKVADFCELEWDILMTKPEKSETMVQTASVVQVRQQIHERSLGSWKQHASLLRPFMEGLDFDLWPEVIR